MAKLKILRLKNDPSIGDEGVIKRTTTSLDDTADIRDALSFLAGKGYSSLSDDESRKTFGRLSALVGAPKAQKLATQVFLFNQRPEIQKFTPEQRVNAFYDIGSSDKDIAPFIEKAKNFGSGVLPGFRNSALLGNMQLSGKEVNSPLVNISTDKEKLAKQILLGLKK